jgi:hypothetical protein
VKLLSSALKTKQLTHFNTLKICVRGAEIVRSELYLKISYERLAPVGEANAAEK